VPVFWQVPKTTQVTLSRRERQILDVLYRLERASAAEVREALDDAPSYSAVRTLLGVLEEKGHIRHEADGLKYVYMPTIPREKARRSVIRHMMDTYFGGSPEQAVAALLDVSSGQLNREDLNRMAAMIEKAKKEGK
jgi:BlaI family transcriptional regulator, penicillinase repressor